MAGELEIDDWNDEHWRNTITPSQAYFSLLNLSTPTQVASPARFRLLGDLLDVVWSALATPESRCVDPRILLFIQT